MYFASVILLVLILPVGSALMQWEPGHGVVLLGKWMVFWAAGVRLLLAGARQIVQPRFTAEEIFELHDPGTFAIVRELGFANVSMGILGICTIFRAGWTIPGALVGGLYYGLAAVGHVFRKSKNAKERLATVSDVFVFLVLAVFVAVG